MSDLPCDGRCDCTFGDRLALESSRSRYNQRMPSHPMEVAVQKRLIEQWRETGRVLTDIRKAELAAQSPEESRLAAWDMLQLGAILPPDPARENECGLVEMQRLFAKLRGSGVT
jgi:hypothetical protein